MKWQLVVLWTDALVYVLVALVIAYVIWVMLHEHLRVPWRQVARRRLGMIAAVVLLAYVVIGLLDSVHVRFALPQQGNGKIYYSTQVDSLLDILISPIGQHSEKSYSAPFATHAASKAVIKDNGIKKRDYPRLAHAGQHLTQVEQKPVDIALKIIVATAWALLVWAIICLPILILLAKRQQLKFTQYVKIILTGKTRVAWREIFIAFAVVLIVLSVSLYLAYYYHVLGTDKVGQDVFYAALKSIRTGLLIGTLATLFMLPFALLLGPLAGYYSGWVDDGIQYIYTTLSSIPGVLLISASVLALQVFIANHTELFPTLMERADARLLALCIILGITSWTSLCRLLRAESLKLREIDFIRASQALGVSRLKIISRHILPNVMHIVLITIVLDFSALVLAEAVLSYVGVGVDPTTFSWGNMINAARLELAREPVVWWPLLSAFLFMFVLVLAANLFADCVRDAFDPRLREVSQ